MFALFHGKYAGACQTVFSCRKLGFPNFGNPALKTQCWVFMSTGKKKTSAVLEKSVFAKEGRILSKICCNGTALMFVHVVFVYE